jgi:uncharacterized membrane protein
MLKYLTGYGSAAATFVLLDALWLSTMGAILYRPVLGTILADQIRIVPAVVFYLMFLAGIVYFGIAPALETGRWTTALLNGAVLGLLAYGTYDLTNHATLQVWELKVTLADMAWGAFVTGMSSTAGFLAASWVAQRA